MDYALKDLGLGRYSIGEVADYVEDSALEVYLYMQHRRPFNIIVFYIVFVFILWRLCLKLAWSRSFRSKKSSNSTEALLKILESETKEFKDQVLNAKPKVPQNNYNPNPVTKKIENFTEKINEIQEMHSKFQADILDSHIKIFKILNNIGDKEYLQLPETELVEPDSALPPLESNLN